MPRAVGAEVVAIARELVRIPAHLFMRVAEFTGALVLRAWLVVWPIFKEVWRLVRRGLAIAEREVTPARATVTVAAVIAICLAASQFLDYRAVQIGTPEYTGVESVAPPPKVESAVVGGAHLWLGVPLGILALAIIVLAARGRAKVARALIPIGLVAVAISLFVDAPKGLDDGDAAAIYSGAKATLENGFWAQLVSAALLVVMAFLLVRALPRSERDLAKAGG